MSLTATVAPNVEVDRGTIDLQRAEDSVQAGIVVETEGGHGGLGDDVQDRPARTGPHSAQQNGLPQGVSPAAVTGILGSYMMQSKTPFGSLGREAMASKSSQSVNLEGCVTKLFNTFYFSTRCPFLLYCTIQSFKYSLLPSSSPGLLFIQRI